MLGGKEGARLCVYCSVILVGKEQLGRKGCIRLLDACFACFSALWKSGCFELVISFCIYRVGVFVWVRDGRHGCGGVAVGLGHWSCCKGRVM
jgi:hypothetical protein